MSRGLRGARTVLWAEGTPCAGMCQEDLDPSLRQPHASSFAGVPWPFARQTLRMLRFGLWCCWVGPSPCLAQDMARGRHSEQREPLPSPTARVNAAPLEKLRKAHSGWSVRSKQDKWSREGRAGQQ